METTQLQGSCCKESNSAFLSSLEMRAQRRYRLYIQIQNDSENRRVAVSVGLLILATWYYSAWSFILANVVFLTRATLVRL